MFPNPQDALPLPPHPSLEQYKKRAKNLVQACRSSDPNAIRAWAAAWIEALIGLSKITITPHLPVRLDHWTDQLEQFARKELSESRTLSAAQFVIARAQGFESWPHLTNHLTAITRANSPTTSFELAADAIVTGDLATLQNLLRENPDLIHAHSTRRHHATLLHYVSANGVEGYRQKTPKNIVKIADLLLGGVISKSRTCPERIEGDLLFSVVNATADIYSSSTTLDLVATSLHPERAGVQQPLMHLLLNHGATITPKIVNACLANGRAPAAEFLAQRGATLDLEAAAGVGRLDIVESCFDESGNLKSPETAEKMERGFLWACEYGRNEVVEFLLLRGVNGQSQAGTGQTALHWAVIGGHLDTIDLLIAAGAPLEATNIHGGTALGQALWSALHTENGIDYVPVIQTLMQANARVPDGALARLAEQKFLAPSVRNRLAAVLQQGREGS